jgi:hypothetical protein
MRDLDERQSRLFFLIVTFLVRYEPPELHAIIDEDVVEATAAIAATFETAARGVIYEHRPASLSADRLANELTRMLAEAGEQGGAAFRRDAAVVLRRVETAAREATQGGGGRRAFLDLAGRVTAPKRPERIESGEVDQPPRVIIP